jgi:membrane protein implicated in regulation of membrane protease activity
VTWANFYLICFVVGFAFSFLGFLSGSSHWRLHIPHLPHGHGGFTHIGHVAGHAPVGAHAPVAHGGAGAKPGQAAQGGISPFNFITLTAFLAWFGGTGYLLTRYETLWFLTGLGIALFSGLAGGALVYLFLSRVLTSPNEDMDQSDYEMVGVLGRTSLPIREGGTGEIIYSQAGTRRTCGARSDNGSVIGRGVEVVVTRYEKGIAYVRPWEEMAGEQGESES